MNIPASNPTGTQSINRVNHTANFTIISNDVHDAKELSFKAKGLLGYLLSKPDDWKTYISQLAKVGSDGKISVYNGVRELMKAGYISKIPIRDGQGKFLEWQYLIYEDPKLNPAVNSTSNPLIENPFVENRPLTSTDFFNKKEQTCLAKSVPDVVGNKIKSELPEEPVCSFLKIEEKPLKPVSNEVKASVAVETAPVQPLPSKVSKISNKATHNGLFNHPIMDQLTPEQKLSCAGVCGEIFKKEGEAALSFYVNYVIKYNKKKLVKNFGAYLRTLYRADAYGQYLEKKKEKETEAQSIIKKDIKICTDRQEEQAHLKIEHEKKLALIASVDKNQLDDFIIHNEKVPPLLKNMYKKGKMQILLQGQYIKEFILSLGLSPDDLLLQT